MRIRVTWLERQEALVNMLRYRVAKVSDTGSFISIVTASSACTQIFSPIRKPRAVNPYSWDPDPGPGFKVNPDPDPEFHVNPDPEFRVNPDTNPDPILTLQCSQKPVSFYINTTSRL
jgi:hypothetical protein